MAHFLPKEYQELSYINNGTAGYIITDIYPTGNDKAYFKAKATSLSPSGNMPMFGNYHNTASTADFVFYLGKQSGVFYYWQNGRQYNFTTASVANKIFEASADYKNGVFSITVDGNTETQTQTPNTFTCANKLPIGVRYTTSYGGVQQYDIYEYKHWRNEELIADLVPAKRLSDNEVGMYDVVSKTFFTNAGTGTFTAGQEITIKKRIVMTKDKVLPDEYQELSYIEATGQQLNNTTANAAYIDTGFIPTTKSKFEMSWQFDSIISSGETLFGCTTPRFAFGYTRNVSTTAFYFGLGDKNQASTFRMDTNRHTFAMDYNDDSWSVDNTTGTITGTNKSEPVNTFYLFARHSGTATTANKPCDGKLYWFKFWDNGILVRDMIPCYRKSDGKVGIYDKVGKKFYTTKGTKEFTRGEEVRNLPYGYEQVEYLESSGTQYIDTGIIGNGSTKIDIRYQYHQLGSTTAGTGRIFGSRTSSASNNLSFGSRSGNLGSSQNTIFFGYNTTSTGDTPTQTIDTNIHDFHYDNEAFKIDGTTYWTQALAIFTTPQNLKIFGFDNGGTIGCGIGRCYGCKIYNNTLVRDFVPARRLSDNALGMWDMVSNTFFTNQGTGAFTAGQSIPNKFKPRLVFMPKEMLLPSAYQKVEYIESSGTQYIDTGYMFNNISLAKSIISISTNRTDSSTNLALCLNGSGSVAYWFGTCSGKLALGASSLSTFSALERTETTVVKSSAASISATTNGETITRTGGSVISNPTTTWLFHGRGTTGVEYWYIGKLYYCKLFDNDILVRDLVPVIRKTDNVAGMYDTVNGVFYTNAGTGTFLTGSEVHKGLRLVIMEKE